LWEVASVLYRTPAVTCHVGPESLGELNMKLVSRITLIIVTLVVETLYLKALCFPLPYAM